MAATAATGVYEHAAAATAVAALQSPITLPPRWRGGILLLLLHGIRLQGGPASLLLLLLLTLRVRMLASHHGETGALPIPPAAAAASTSASSTTTTTHP